jgi:hypothetical protein
VLLLNFKRNKFFPAVLGVDAKTPKRTTLLSLSLGVLNKAHGLKKSLKTAKPSYLRLSEFLRNCLLSLGKTNVDFLVRGTPKYLKELLSEFLKKSDKNVENPFAAGSLLGSRLLLGHSISTNDLTFSAPYPYKSQKVKKKGRVKRKILKKVVKVNRMVD